MFICDAGNHISERNEKCTLVTVETRQKEYKARSYQTKHGSVNDPGGFGTEIVRQEKRCLKHIN